MSNNPLVSIVIPTFKPRHFEGALLSALNQRYDSLEILISDDCPTDSIQQIVERHLLHSRHPIRIIRNQPGLGGLLNYTQCVVEARGEFVKFLNDDDILLGDCVERMVEIFQDNLGVSLVTSKRILIDDFGNNLPDIYETCSPFENDVVINGSDLVSFLVDAPQNFIGEPSTVMFRREHLVDVKPNICCLDGHTVRAINDLAMYVNILRYGDMAYLIKPLSCFRKHAEQRQAQPDMFPLWQQGVEVFTRQIRAMGLYRPLDGGLVRCKSLLGDAREWQPYPLRSKLAEFTKRLSSGSVLTMNKNKDLNSGSDGSHHLLPVLDFKGSIAVVVHAFYPDVLEEILCALKPLFGIANFYFTTSPDKACEVGKIIDLVVPNCNLYIFENRGRDVGPLFELMQVVDLENFKYILKLHTKKSPHLNSGGGGKWRSKMLQQLLPEGGIQQVLNFLESNSGIGLAGSSSSLFKASEFLGANFENYEGLKRLAEVLGFDFDNLDYNFIGGTMFWARGAVFRELKNLTLRQSDFEEEAGQLDGTLAHIIERIIPLAAMKAGLKTVGLPDFQMVRVWNDARNPSNFDLIKIKEFLQLNNGGPEILVAVLDDGKDSSLLIETLESIYKCKSLYENLSAIVFGYTGYSLRESYPRVSFLDCNPDGLLSSLNNMLDDFGYDWFLIIRPGEELLPNGFLSAAINLLSASECRAVYSDEFIEMSDGTLLGMLRPSFNLDMLVSIPLLMARHWFIPKKVFNSLDGYNSKITESFEFDLIIRIIEEGGISGIGHISEPLLIGKSPELKDSEQDRY